MTVRTIVTALLATVALSARAEAPFPARGGTTGLLDVPDASTVGQGRGVLGAELRFDQPSRAPAAAGPLPIYAVAGLTDGLDLGLSMREWGQPGDRLPSRTTFGAAGKLSLLRGEERPLRLALVLDLDRINATPVGGARLVASSRLAPALQVSAFLGGESAFAADRQAGATWGAALAVAARRDLTAILEGLGGPRGENVGVALRWDVRPTIAYQLAFNYLPSDDGFRVSLGIAFRPSSARRAAPTEPVAEPAAAAPKAEAVAFQDPRPQFRLRMPGVDAARAGEPVHVQHAPYARRTDATVTLPSAARPPRPAAPSADEVASAQLADQEAQAAARERRLRDAAAQLDAREAAAQGEARRLDARATDLAERERSLDARERGDRQAPRRVRTPQEQQLQSQELQLAARERQLTAQVHGLDPAIEAAQGRERDAAAREDVERGEASRLSASLAGASTATQNDLRKQLLATRGRQHAAIEVRLVAKAERLDALEQQLRTEADRLDAWSRRLDTRAERLDAASRPSATATAELPPPAATGPAAPQPKDRSVFVMVAKSPTAIVKERPGAEGAAPAPAATAAVEAVSVALVAFPTPAAALSELDGEAVDRIAKVAAREGASVLVWARAREPGLLAEAQRRAAQLRARVLAAGELEGSRVVTRITTRPGAPGVDVIVSVVRDGTGASGTHAPAPPPARGEAPAPGHTEALGAGETRTRQLREAVVAARPSIEACVAPVLDGRNLARAEGVLRITVAPDGHVLTVTTGRGVLTGAELDQCFVAAARGWVFPRSDADYALDVPITILRGGAKR